MHLVHLHFETLKKGILISMAWAARTSLFQFAGQNLSKYQTPYFVFVHFFQNPRIHVRALSVLGLVTNATSTTTQHKTGYSVKGVESIGSHRQEGPNNQMQSTIPDFKSLRLHRNATDRRIAEKDQIKDRFCIASIRILCM
jgi:hypothetical protein